MRENLRALKDPLKGQRRTMNSRMRRRKQKPKSQRRPGLWVRLVRLGLIAAGLSMVLGLAALFAGYWYFSRDLPEVASLQAYDPPQVIRVLDRSGRPIGEIGEEKRTVVPLADVPQVLVDAVVAAEDATFFDNPGLDLKGIARAFYENVVRGRKAQGGSTITQQVIKRLLLTPERKYERKIKEIILAYRLTKTLSKPEILEIYLNEIYYGHGRYGCEEAARFFFGKSVSDVHAGEAALLAGMPQSPSYLSPLNYPQRAKTRQRYVLSRMAELGLIAQKEAQRWAREPIRVVRNAVERVAPEIMTLVRSEEMEALVQQGGDVHVTVDADLQVQARTAVERGLEDLDERQGFNRPSEILGPRALKKKRQQLRQARDGSPLSPGQIVEAVIVSVEADSESNRGDLVLVVDTGAGLGRVNLADEPRYVRGDSSPESRFLPGGLVRVRRRQVSASDGDALIPLALELGPQAALVAIDIESAEVLALVGGYDFQPGNFDRSRRAKRQVGSTFKPFVYAAALETGAFTAASVVNDAPDVYDLWKPRNYERTFRGPIRIREALAHSVNTVAIKVLHELGLESVTDFVGRLGVQTPRASELGLSLALGSISLTPFELASAYLPVFNGGYLNLPHIIQPGIIQPTEAQAPGDTSGPVQVLSPELSFLTVSMLRSVVTDGTGRKVAARLRRPAAGKTGTSNDGRDAWFAGATTQLLTVVWVGFDDVRRLGRGETGGGAALPIWLDFMNNATDDHEVADFTPPSTIEVHRIDKETGLLALPGEEGINEMFIPGTAPEQSAQADKNPDLLLLSD